MNKLCGCGCGEEMINERNRFISGHNRRGKTISKEHKIILSKSNTGRYHTQESKEKISKANKGRILSAEQRIHQSIAITGKRASEETKRKLSLMRLGVSRPSEVGRNISKSLIGKKHSIERRTNISKNHGRGFLGRKHSEETKKKMRLSAIKQIERQLINDEPLCPRISIPERACLNEFQLYTTHNIIRNDHSISNLIGFYPDGHILELKLFIEFDEQHHFMVDYITRISKDIERELILASLGYIIFRVSKKDWEEDQLKVVNQFKELTSLILE